MLYATNTLLQPPGGALEVFVTQGDRVWVVDRDVARTSNKAECYGPLSLNYTIIVPKLFSL